MKYNLKKLKNGIELLAVPMASLESATVTIWVCTGTRNEADKILGISHFMEHMAFKGGKKYDSAKKVSETIDAIGGEFNASTSKEWTQYYIRCRSQNLDTAFDVLSDMILFPLLKKSDIKREKGVIVEEIGMYEDTPMKKVWDYFERLIYTGHELGRDIIGTRKTVTGLKRADFTDYIGKHYFAENILIVVSGGIDGKVITDLSTKYFVEMRRKEVQEGKGIKVNQEKPRLKIYEKDIQQAHVVLGFPADELGQSNRYNDAVLNSVLSGGMSSRLFTEVREKRGLCYAVRSAFDRYTDNGYWATYVGTDPQKATEAIKVVLDQAHGLADGKYKVGNKEFKKAKEYIKGHLALSLEDTRGVNSFFGHDQLLLGKIRTPRQVMKAVEAVKVEDIYKAAKRVFLPEKLNLTVIGPFGGDARFKKLLV